MAQSVTRRRPWLAALLSVVATGLGHLYLRRWKRAVGWLALLFVTATLFVDQRAVDALTAGGPVDFVAVAPLLIVGGLNVLDAYVVAHAENALRAATNHRVNAGRCPQCGREVDPDLDFCHWCSAPLDAAAPTAVVDDEAERR